MSLIETGKRLLRKEAQTLLDLSDALDDSFDRAVDLLAACRGKVILTGMGKSGIICRKIAATFSSTGTPAFFLHPAEGAHGDLGVLSQGDVVLAVSNSGETNELLGLLPLIRRMGLPLVSITGNERSTLATRSNVLLHVCVADEGCPLNLAPMSSTTATLALGDALAAALMERRNVTAEDFALVHPAGALGRRLTLRVEDLMVEGAGVPRVGLDDPMREVLCVISDKRLGLTGVFDGQGRLAGVVTDGDLRRGLQSLENFLDVPAQRIMNAKPKTVPRGTLAFDALRLMEDHAITSLFVTEENGWEICGVLHIHHLLKEGLA